LLTPENDIFALAQNNDENYTGGMKIGVLTPVFKWKLMPFSRFQNDQAKYTASFRGGTAWHYWGSITLGLSPAK
jgi:hypothetical protein